MEQLLRMVRMVLGSANILVKPHPAESVDEYERLIGSMGDQKTFLLPKDMNIVDALTLSDALISIGISSPSYYAKIIGLPQSIYRFPGKTADAGHLPNFIGIPIASDWEEMPQVLMEMMKVMQQRKAGVEGVKVSDVRLDGMVAARIVDDMERRG